MNHRSCLIACTWLSVALFPIFSKTQSVFTPVSPTVISLPSMNYVSSAWGDYNNDGKLDLLLAGSTADENLTQLYRQTDTGSFEDRTIDIPGVAQTRIGSVGWADYDNDGQVDFLLTGLSTPSGFPPISRLYHQTDAGTFEDRTNLIPNLPGVYFSSVDWGDYDNDGRPDFLLTGYTGNGGVTRLYHQTASGSFEDKTSLIANVAQVYNGGVDWGDYDNDGRLDFLVTGVGNSGVNFSARLYHQTSSGEFEDKSSLVPGLAGHWYGSVAWSDYDNDGRLDFVLSGLSNSGPVTQLFRQMATGGFADKTSLLTGLQPVSHCSTTWADYDNDGRTDLLLTGQLGFGAGLLTQLFRQTATGSFQNATSSIPGVQGVRYASTSWGDYNNDGRLDLLYAGETVSENRITQLYLNNTPLANTRPSSPTSLQSTLATNGQSVTLTWGKAQDAQTPQESLNYTLYISDTPRNTNPHAATVLAPMADKSTGFRRVVQRGERQSNQALFTGLTGGQTYYWGVQAIDNGFAGSPFSTEQSFTVPLNAPTNVRISSNIICPGSSVTLTADACPSATLNWYARSGVSTVVGIGTPLVVTPTTDASSYTYLASCKTPHSEAFAATTLPLTLLTVAAPTGLQAVSMCPGSTVNLTALGCSGSEYALRWYRAYDNQAVSMPVAPALSTTYYARCQRSNGVVCLSEPSQPVLVRVGESTRIILPPTSQTIVCEGSTIIVPVRAGGEGSLRYSWFKNGQSIPGQTGNTLALIPAKASDTGSYSVLVAGACGEVRSAAFDLPIEPNPTCGSPVCTLGEPLELQEPIYNCATFQLKFVTRGGEGTPISYSAVGITGPTTNCTATLDAALGSNIHDNQPSVSPFLLVATQAGNQVTYSWNALAACGYRGGVKRYVSATGTNPTAANATSWATATPDLQGAINASTAYDQVWVQGGVYKPTNNLDRTRSFSMKDRVSIYGGFRGTETTLAERPTTFPSSSTLSGELGNPFTSNDNSYHVIRNPSGLAITSVLDGFVITGGNASGTGLAGSGGGVLNDGSGTGRFCSPTFRYCRFVNNDATVGGAMYNGGNSGGTSSPQLAQCTFTSNKARNGGGLFNNAEYSGVSSPTLIGCSFETNRASSYGGGLLNSSHHSGICSPLLANCIFANNFSSSTGGAILNNGYSAGTNNLTVVNSTFIGNETGSVGWVMGTWTDYEGNAPLLTNCIIWPKPFNPGNGYGDNTFFGQKDHPVIQYSLLDRTISIDTFSGSPTNTITSASPFSYSSLQLNPCSSAINAGDPAISSAVVGQTDLATNPRFANGRIDMGAFEYQSVPVADMVSVKDGLWSDASTWSCERVPVITDPVQVNHVVTLPATYTGEASLIRFGSGATLHYQNGAILNLRKL